jgi:hypothetical protein
MKQIIRAFLLTIVLPLALIVGGFLLVHAYINSRAPNAQKIFRQATKAAHDTTKIAAAEVARVTPITITTRATYTATRADVLRNKPTPREILSFQTSDAALVATDVQHNAEAALVVATTREVKVWQSAPPPPRVLAYGEAMYDLAHAVPVMRLGITARVVGPVSLSAAGEYAPPSFSNLSGASVRALIGVRVTF